MEELLEVIKKFEQILIFRHKNPDPDAIGSQCGLRQILQRNFPEKKVRALGVNEATLSYLAEMDAESDVALDKPFLAIICDTANQPRVDGDLWCRAASLIKIDHHPNDDAYGDLQWVESERSSTSEMIADWAFASELTVDTEAARLLYAGIVGDTGRFLFPSTSSKTLQLAGRLAERDFDRSALSREMTSFDRKIARLHGYVYENVEISEQGAARVLLTQELLEAHGLRDAETSSIVGLPGNIREIKLWAIFVEQADGHFRVRMRSKGLPVDDIAKAHDGGGHELAAGANSYSLEENETIWEEMQQKLER